MEFYELEFTLSNVYKESGLPANENEKIIYVFRDTSDKDEKTWTIHKILYIGESTNAKNRLNSNHEKIPLAHEKLAKGHFLTFAYYKFHGNISDDSIRAVENALIAANKPELNDQNKKEYHFDKYPQIKVICKGPRATLLKETISYEKK